MATEGNVYYFRATGAEGGIVSGQLEAHDHRAAADALVAKGLTPIRVEVGGIKDSLLSRELGIASSKRLTDQDCETFSRELHLLIGSGVNLSDALAVLVATQNKRTRVQKFATAVHRSVRSGRPLSDAVLASGFDLPADFVPVLRAGESSGSLVVPLAMLSESYRATANFARSFSSALVYPAFLLAVALIALGIIAFVVAPTLAELFSSLDKPVPGTIAFLDGAAQVLVSNALLVLVGLAAAAVMLVWLIGRPSVRRFLRALAFRLPIVGPLFIWGATSRFAATLRLYVKSNVPMAKALPGACQASGFPNCGSIGNRVASSLRTGGKLGDALKLIPLLPVSTWQLLNIGESGGRLPEALTAVVAESQHRFETRAALIGSMLAPVLIVLVGGTVGGLVFVVFSALLEVNNIAS